MGCQPLPICTPGAKEGRTYTIKIISKEMTWVGGSSSGNGPSCAGFDGLEIGATVAIKMTGYREADTCKGAVGEVVRSPNPSPRTAKKPAAVSAAILSASSDVDSPNCYKYEYLALLAHPDKRQSFLSPPIPGASPPALLHRRFSPLGTDPACPNYCEDLFGVSVEESQ